MIFNKCPFCNETVWFFNERTFFLITPDWGLWSHKRCYTRKNALEYHKKWFEDIDKEIKDRKN